jgi:hypothetical protein
MDPGAADDLDRFCAAVDKARTADKLEAISWEIFEDLLLAVRGVGFDSEPDRGSPRWKQWIASQPGAAAEVARRSRFVVTPEEVARIQRDYTSALIVEMPRHGRVVRMPRCSDAARFERWEFAQLRRHVAQMLTRLALVSEMPARWSEAITGRSAPAHRPHHGTRDPVVAGARLLERCSPGRTEAELRGSLRMGRPSSAVLAVRDELDAAVLGVLANQKATREAVASFLERDVRTVDRCRDRAVARGASSAPAMVAVGERRTLASTGELGAARLIYAAGSPEAVSIVRAFIRDAFARLPQGAVGVSVT